MSSRLLGTGRCVLFFLLFWSGHIQASPVDPYEKINRGWERFGAVYGRIVESYYADLDQDEIMRAAIEGMLRELDAYSQFYDEKGLRRLRQDTTGKFAGLGITVAIKDEYPIVISPIEGTPADRAGLRPGDLIVGIEGKDTRGMSLEEVVDTLRGEPGTRVRIEVARQIGEKGVREFTITREIIEIRSVNLVEEIRPGVGYISMRHTRFSEDTASEVEKALEDLKAKGVRNVILDLRGNPGGLLNQATQVADLFLPKGAPIVSIRERNGRIEEEKISQRDPVAGEMPLVVLIDGGSASASEIVAGAIQDNDRGIILGTPSFGKGSVQTIFDLYDAEDSALKLTTALYYTPSGRSIHRALASSTGKLSFQLSIGEVRLPAGPTLDIILRADDAAQAAAGLRARYDLEKSEVDEILSTSLGELAGGGRPIGGASRAKIDTLSKKVYYTRNGRKVYGGGGITPDVRVDTDLPPEYVLDLERRRIFFDFVVDYLSEDSLRVVSALSEQNPEMMEQFEEFLRSRKGEVEYARIAHREIRALKRLADEMGWGEEVKASIERVEKAMQAALDRGFTAKLAPYIQRALRRELALLLHGERARLLADLESDPYLREALTLLRDENRYSQVLAKRQVEDP